MQIGSTKRNKLFNLIMAALIAVVVCSGVITVGMVKGWFGSSENDSDIVTTKVTGVANIERSGVGYTLEENEPLRVDDVVATETGSEVEFTVSDVNAMAMDEDTEFTVTANEKNDIGISVSSGEIFADVPNAGNSFEIQFGDNTAHITGTVFSVNMQKGSCSLNVYEGDVEIDVKGGSTETVQSGEYISIVDGSSGKTTADVAKLKAKSLSDFVIAQATDCKDSDKLCFTTAELQKVADSRAKEKEQAEKKAEEKDETISADKKNSKDKKSESTTTNENGKSGKSSSGKSSSSKNVKKCTVTIRCDTILDNMDKLTAGKSKYVPSNGVILSARSVEFTDGETVFDALKRACKYADIQLEYAYTPGYDSYYIEGINNLYEFDCGSNSGWMYKVNGWFPNYGCSSYKLKDGDAIVWTYTCEGLGSDVGGSAN